MFVQRASVAAVIIAMATAFSGCSGGGSATPQTSSGAPAMSGAIATATPTPTPAPAANAAIHSTPYTPSQSTDVQDQHPVAAPIAANAAVLLSGARSGNIHLMPVQPGFGVTSKGLTRTLHGSRSPRTFIDNPLDVAYYGGPVLGGTVSHLIYVSTNYESCGTSCWGNPSQFLTDLGASNFIHYLDQYIGQSANNRYTKGTGATVQMLVIPPNYPTQNPVISQTDIMVIVLSAAQALGTSLNYQNVYHVLLPPYTDTCVDLTSICYSPDKASSFAFCAYHGSLDAGGGVHFVYTVEPYQGVPGCGFSNVGINNNTASSLSHEMFETITDPDPYSGWNRPNDASEIGDICRFYFYNVALNGNNYFLQSEYSNSVHACVNG